MSTSALTSPPPPQLLFAAEFATFLVAVAGASVGLLRPFLLEADRRSRLMMAAGFVALGVASFLRGSLLVGFGDPFAVVATGAGIVAMGTGALGWHGAPARRWLWVALGLMAGAEAALVLDLPWVAAATRGAGACAVGVILVGSARRSIPARFAMTMAATLLGVVMALAVALSVVVGRTVATEGRRRVSARAGAEAAEIVRAAAIDSVGSARLGALTLQGSRAGEVAGLLAGAGGSIPPAAVAGIAADLRLLADQDLLAADGPLLFAGPEGQILVAQRVTQPAADRLVRSPAVAQVLTGRAESASAVEVIDGRGLAVGAHRVTTRQDQVTVLAGVIVATRALDDDYLDGRTRADPSLTLALTDGTTVSATSGADLTQDAVRRLASRALARNRSVSGVDDGLFLAAEQVRDGDGPAVLVVLSAVSANTDLARAPLFRVLFGVALAAALGAFVLAVAVGERIGRGLGRLAGAARRISQGDLSVRASVSSTDEVGALGTAFNSMAGSIEELARELRDSMDQEVSARGRLQAVVAGMGEALVAVDARGCVVEFNPAAERLFGLEVAEVMGRRLNEFATIGDGSGRDLAESFSRPVDRPVVTAASVALPGQGPIPVALSVAALPGGSGGSEGNVLVLRDVRAEREAERVKAALLANISHELRTPLVPVKGYAQLLLSRDLPTERANELLGHIVTAADRLESTVARLLAVAADDRTGSREALDPGEVVEGVAIGWRARVGASHRVVAVVEADLPPVMGDRSRLTQGLDELVSNAVKFAPDGGDVTIGASVGGRHHGEEPTVAFSVSDQGIGVAPGRLDELFEAFVQADGSDTREFGGMGLGLTLARRAAEWHGGTLEARSTPGVGSTFTIRLPVLPGAVGAPETALDD
ncbi:MAG: ATP-binding protein [Acidimicrobiales bacterium]